MQDWSSIFDPATVAELVGVDALPDRADDVILAWVERVFPHADPLDRYAFAEYAAYLATGWLGGWGILDRARPRDLAAQRLVEAATGNPGGGVVQRLTFDDAGRHQPPGHDDLADWTRWMWARLVAHYFSAPVED